MGKGERTEEKGRSGRIKGGGKGRGEGLECRMKERTYQKKDISERVRRRNC